jgi:hypothetical protein
VGADPSPWLEEAVSVFGEECRLKLAGPGDREAAIRSPLEALLRTVGEHIGVPAVFHDEVRDVDRRVRPVSGPFRLRDPDLTPISCGRGQDHYGSTP